MATARGGGRRSDRRDCVTYDRTDEGNGNIGVFCRRRVRRDRVGDVLRPWRPLPAAPRSGSVGPGLVIPALAPARLFVRARNEPSPSRDVQVNPERSSSPMNATTRSDQLKSALRSCNPAPREALTTDSSRARWTNSAWPSARVRVESRQRSRDGCDRDDVAADLGRVSVTELLPALATNALPVASTSTPLALLSPVLGPASESVGAASPLEPVAYTVTDPPAWLAT